MLSFNLNSLRLNFEFSPGHHLFFSGHPKKLDKTAEICHFLLDVVRSRPTQFDYIRLQMGPPFWATVAHFFWWPHGSDRPGGKDGAKGCGQLDSEGSPWR